MSIEKCFHMGLANLSRAEPPTLEPPPEVRSDSTIQPNGSRSVTACAQIAGEVLENYVELSARVPATDAASLA